ncbi:MAG TPA: class E sortase [Marmoricola sp.]|jgi:sortase A|nr:class E sortase [Marmoricola sp.]
MTVLRYLAPRRGTAARRRPGARKKARPRNGRLLLPAGVLLSVSGVGLAGYLHLQHHQDAAAAVESEKRSAVQLQQTVQHVEDSWARGIATGDVGLLRIARFDQKGSEFVEPIVDGWTEDDLARGVGLYPDGAKPGERGNVVLAGHRITHGSPFADFPNLKVGDLVQIETQHAIVTYKLTTTGTRYRVLDTSVWPTWSTPDPDNAADLPTTQRYLTLVTCAETYHTEWRNVAVAREVSRQPVDRAGDGAVTAVTS